MAIHTKIPTYDPSLLEKHTGSNSLSPITFRGYTAESLLKAYREAGPVYQTTFNDESVYIFTGLDANEKAWTTPDDWSYHDAVAVFREELSDVHLTQLDKAPHRRKRRLLNKGFKNSSVMAGMPAMAREIAMGLAQMEGRTVEFHQSLMQVFTRSHAKSSVKEAFTDEEIARMVDFEEGFIGALFLKKPHRELIYNRASYLDIKNAVLGRLHGIVKERLDESVTKDDMLDAVIHQKVTGNIEGLSEEELIYDTYLLLIAGTGNTSKLICYLLQALLDNSEWRAKLEEELKDFDASKLAGGMKEFPLLKATLMETERMFPAAPVLPRVPSQDIEFLGFPLPKGAQCLHCASLTHFDEAIYEDPFKFNPQRWIDNEYPRTAHAVFGGGTHTCLGMNVARIQMPLTIGYLLSLYDYEISKAPVVENYAYPGEIDSQTLRMDLKLIKK